MPTYEFECPRCKTQFERFESMNAAPEAECPECGKMVRRQIGGGVAVHANKRADQPPPCGSDYPCCGGSCGAFPGE